MLNTMLQLEMLLNPGIFSEIRLEVMKELHKHLLICDDSVTSEQLQTKLQTFGQHLTITCSSRMIMTMTLNKIGELFQVANLVYRLSSLYTTTRCYSCWTSQLLLKCYKSIRLARPTSNVLRYSCWCRWKNKIPPKLDTDSIFYDVNCLSY